ncbi:MAG TPA: deoxyribonuclease V [Gammaproteobacteria bacterium]|nr:deoxyribonuclease V [Gammaproteobacteria bacterium]
MAPLVPYISIPEARARQENMRGQVIREGAPQGVRRVAGVDCGFPGEHQGSITRAAVAVLSWPELELVEKSVVERPTDFPYIPGFLSFREVPAILAALARLKTAPDLLIVDGHGYAHPRGFGIACHLGVETGIPSIGAGKSRLVGEFRAPAEAAGSRQPLRYKDETVGTVLRTRDGVSPLFVSSGHKISLDAATEWVLDCCRGYRLPQTTRWADGLAGDPGFRLKSRRTG